MTWARCSIIIPQFSVPWVFRYRCPSGRLGLFATGISCNTLVPMSSRRARLRVEGRQNNVGGHQIAVSCSPGPRLDTSSYLEVVIPPCSWLTEARPGVRNLAHTHPSRLRPLQKPPDRSRITHRWDFWTHIRRGSCSLLHTQQNSRSSP